MGKMEVMARIARYGMVGIIANLSGYGLFLALLFAGMPPVLTTGIIYLIIVSATYYSNRRWTFRSNSAHSRDALRYVIAHSIGLTIAVGTMHFISALLHPAIAQIVVMIVAALVIYTSLEVLGFGRTERNDAH